MTVKVHTEEAFETLIVEHLTAEGGYTQGTSSEYDFNEALIKQDLIDHIKLDTYTWKKVDVMWLDYACMAWIDRT